MEYARPELLVEPDWVAEHANDANVRIIDCAVLEAYRRAHIPGAVHLPVHYYIKEKDPEGTDHGTLVMPPGEFEALMGSLGVSNDTLVITYDDNNALVASRLWWVLNYYGHTNVKVLNGGWHRWLTEGRPVTFHATRAPKTTFKAVTNPDLVATVDQLKEQHSDPGACQVLDARTDGEWDGTNNRGNRRAGRVPNARHLEWVRFVGTDDSRKFLPAGEIQKLLDEAGIARDTPTITYCQGGIRAAHAAFTLTLLGYDNVRVYDGSMREWANRDDTPLVV
ncbi:MAG TPA: sulfurtransferase [Tepidiformaceae bacterium]|nr:sulfurtransferase [Tepidiformaceae bacterium]